MLFAVNGSGQKNSANGMAGLNNALWMFMCLVIGPLDF